MRSEDLLVHSMLSHPYKARIYQTVAQSITTGSDSVQINLDTVDYDPNGNCTTGASAHYTAPVSGIYLVCAAVSVAWATNQGSAFITMTGVVSGHDQDRRTIPALTHNLGLKSGSLCKITAGTTVALEVFQNSGANRNTIPNGGASVYLEIHLICAL